MLCEFYILVPLQNNNVKEKNSKFYGERRYSCVFSFLYLDLSTVVIDSLKQIFRCDVFVGVSDRIQCHSVLFGREDDGDERICSLAFYKTAGYCPDDCFASCEKSFGFHLSECMGSCFPPPLTQTLQSVPRKRKE